MARTHGPYSNRMRLMMSPEHVLQIRKGGQREKGQWQQGTEWQAARVAYLFSTFGESTCHSAENLGYPWVNGSMNSLWSTKQDWCSKCPASFPTFLNNSVVSGYATFSVKSNIRICHLLLIPPHLSDCLFFHLSYPQSKPKPNQNKTKQANRKQQKTPDRGWQDFLKVVPLPEAAWHKPVGSSPPITLAPIFPYRPKRAQGGFEVCPQRCPCLGFRSEGSTWNQVQELADSFAFQRPK